HNYSVVLSFDFFFSSRRRHTISKRDWISDVCSSDLLEKWSVDLFRPILPRIYTIISEINNRFCKWCKDIGASVDLEEMSIIHNRSEERRVGKECRYRC